MDWRVTKLKAYIDGHAGGVGSSLKHTCEELRLGISPAYLAQLFKRETGLSLKKYAKRERLLIAMERLTNTNDPVKAIATELGYRNPFDFTRAFEEQCGLSPTKFRRADRANRECQSD